MRFCGNFYFNSRYCGFKTLSSLWLLQPLGRGFRWKKVSAVLTLFRTADVSSYSHTDSFPRCFDSTHMLARTAVQTRFLVALIQRATIGSLSKTTPPQRMTPSKKMNLYFTSEIRDCLDLFSSPMALKSC